MALPILLASVAVSFAACGGGDATPSPAGTASGAEPPTSATVRVQAFEFAPDPIEVPVGSTVRFINDDATVHRLSLEKDAVKANLDRSGGSFDHVFSKAGEFKYRCLIHSGPGMRGRVVVR